MSEKKSTYSNQDRRISQEVHYNHDQQENQDNTNPHGYQGNRNQQERQQPRTGPNAAAPPVYSEKDPMAQSNQRYEYSYENESLEEANMDRRSERSSRRGSQAEIQDKPKKSSSSSSIRSAIGRVASAVVVAIDERQSYRTRRYRLIRGLLTDLTGNSKTAQNETPSKR